MDENHLDDGSSSTDFLHAFQLALDTIAAANGDTSNVGIFGGAGADRLPKILALHQFVSRHRFKTTQPTGGGTLRQLSESVRQSLHLIDDDSLKTTASNSQQLLHLLNRPHIKALFGAHDDVTDRRYEPQLPEIPFEVDEDEGAVKIVRLVKTKEPLGATIKCEPNGGSVVIARVIRGGVADRCGCIQVNDRVLEVNGVPVAGKEPTEIVRLLSQSIDTVTFKLIPADDHFFGRNDDQSTSADDDARPRVRAQFDYDARADRLHPCPEAGLSFHRGDILELVDADDEHWWQARNEGRMSIETDVIATGRVGLIPSRLLQSKRSLMQSTASIDDGAHHRGGKTRKLHYEVGQSDDVDDVRVYEPIALMYPTDAIIRPMVLIGPAGVGRNELKRRMLMIDDTKRYATTIPHTSRPKRAHEIDGVDYHFASREDMEQWVRAGRFIEYGEYKSNLYGTLADSVRALITARKTPILNPHPNALRLIRTGEFKPFIVFVKPPPFATLRETRSHSTVDTLYRRAFSDADLEQMIASAIHLERQYGHLFDVHLVNSNIDVAFRQLVELQRRIDTQPSWVPTSWLLQ